MPNFKKIKEIYYSLYELTPKTTLNAKSQGKSRLGALLRINFGNEGIGYADCHPWEELGDLPLREQLQLLSLNNPTSLTKKSILFAKIDAEHRTQNKSVFLNKKFPKNHLITSFENISIRDILSFRNLGFNFIKLKFGKNLETEIKFIKNNYSSFKENNIKIRLDFNYSISKNAANNFFLEIQDKLDIIDFVEDPFEFIPEDWQEIQKNYTVSLALDRKTEKDLDIINTSFEENQSCFQVIVIKPAIEEIQNYYLHPPKKRIIFTSYMDHPIGQLCAIYESEVFYAHFPEKREACGFLTHSLYEETTYSKHLELNNSVLSVKLEPGFGFGELLEKENWISL